MDASQLNTKVSKQASWSQEDKSTRLIAVVLFAAQSLRCELFCFELLLLNIHQVDLRTLDLK